MGHGQDKKSTASSAFVFIPLESLLFWESHWFSQQLSCPGTTLPWGSVPLWPPQLPTSMLLPLMCSPPTSSPKPSPTLRPAAPHPLRDELALCGAGPHTSPVPSWLLPLPHSLGRDRRGTDHSRESFTPLLARPLNAPDKGDAYQLGLVRTEGTRIRFTCAPAGGVFPGTHRSRLERCLWEG